MMPQLKLPASPTSRRLLIAFGALLFFILCWKDLFLEGLVPVDGNTMRFMYPHWALFRAAIPPPRHLLWNPLNNMGEPLLADPGSMAVNPIQWILGGLPHYLNYFQAWVLLHTLIGSVATGLLAWRWYKDQTAAWAAGLVFGLNGFFTSRAPLLNHFAAAAFLPVILYFLDRGAARAVGIAFALQWVAGFPSFSYLSVVFAVAFALLKKGKTLRCLLFGGLWALGLSAVQWIPFLEMLQESQRRLRLDPQIATQFSIPLPQLLKEVLLPQWYRFSPSVNGDPAIVSFYVGLIVLGLAGFGVLRGKGRERSVAWGVAATLLLSMGSFLPGYRYAFPFHLFRFPANWLLGATLGLALLCAAGICRLPTLRWKKLALGILALDLLIFAQQTRTAWSLPGFLEEKPPLADVIQQQPNPGRLYHTQALHALWPTQSMQTSDDFLTAKNLLIPSFGTAWGLAEARSYQVLRSRRAAAFHNRLEQAAPSSDLWKTASISTVFRLAPGARHNEHADIHIWQNKNPLPLLDLEKGGAGKTSVTRLEPGLAEARIQVKKSGLLIFREVFYPGWTVRVDGEKKELSLVEDTFMAVRLGEGTHQVLFRYTPLSFSIGFFVSLVTLILLLLRTYKPWI